MQRDTTLLQERVDGAVEQQTPIGQSEQGDSNRAFKSSVNKAAEIGASLSSTRRANYVSGIGAGSSTNNIARRDAPLIKLDNTPSTTLLSLLSNFCSNIHTPVFTDYTLLQVYQLTHSLIQLIYSRHSLSNPSPIPSKTTSIKAFFK